MDLICRNCGADVCGENPGDHPGFEEWDCMECGQHWDSEGNVWRKGDPKKEGLFDDPNEGRDIEPDDLSGGEPENER